MKLLNKIILSTVLTSISFNAFAYAMVPMTNTEIKQKADTLLRKDLPNQARKYFNELKKRNDVINASWGLALADIAENKNQAALEKVNYLIQLKDTKKDVLANIQAELLINLAEQAYYENNINAAQAYLNQFFSKYERHYKFSKRAKFLHHKIKNVNQPQQIKIGVILPISGKLSKIGKELENALTMALYNQNLSNVTLYFEDNRSTQDGSITAASNILSKGVNMVIGPILKDNVLAANTVLSNAQIPVFAFSTDSSIAGGNVFLNNINLKQESIKIAKVAADMGNYTMACLTPDTKAGDIAFANFTKTVSDLQYFNIRRCAKFNNANVDINPALKDLLEINKNEKNRKKELAKLEKEFKKMGMAMDDDKLAKMEELKNQENMYDINFNAIYIPASSSRIPAIAPQLAFYDIDFTSGVLFLGNSSWDNNNILKNRGENLHFSRFLSLKSDQFKRFAKQYNTNFDKNPSILSGFAYDILRLSKQLDFSQNIYPQLYRSQGFNVLTGNVSFNSSNLAEREYGVNKISRRAIKPVEKVSHQKTIALPNDLNIIKSSGFGNWFGF